MDKSIVLIDGGYLSAITKIYLPEADGKPRKLDFGKLGVVLASKCSSELLRTYYYDAPVYLSPKPTTEERDAERKTLYCLKRSRPEAAGVIPRGGCSLYG